MPQKSWLILSIIILTSCKTGPKVTVCISDPPANGFQCYNKVTEQEFFLHYGASDNYIAFSPQDFRSLVEYCGEINKKSEKEETPLHILPVDDPTDSTR